MFPRYANNALKLLLLCAALLSTSLAQQQLIPHGSQQFFELTNTVGIRDLHQEQAEKYSTSYSLKSQLKVNSVWNSEKEQLLQVYFTESAVSAPSKSSDKEITQKITKIPDRPFYISLVKGLPQKVIAHTSRDQSLLNLERGIASLLQLQYVNGPVSEIDVSGQCNTFYNVKSSTKIEKIKRDCSHWDLRVNYRAEKPLGVSQNSQEHVHFHLTAQGALLTAASTESHRMYLEAKPEAGSEVLSKLTLQHKEVGNDVVEQLNYATLDESIKSLLEWYRVFDIEADVDGALSELKDVTLKQEIAKYASQLADENIGKETLALSFAELLPLARITKQLEFTEILETQTELHPQLADLLGAVQTLDAHNAVQDFFEHNAELFEKYLQALAVGTHPDRGIIENLLKHVNNSGLLVNENLQDTMVQTMAALTRQSGFDNNDPLLQQIRTYIYEQLTKKCEYIECKTLHLRALQNLQDISTLPTLIKYATESEDSELSVAALQALKDFPVASFNEQHRKQFAQIFYQLKRKYDTTARTLALEILFAMKPTKEQLSHLLDYLKSTDRHFEIKTYVIQKLRMLAEKCPRFKALLNSCLSDKPHINNYHIIGQKGLTTVLTRQLSESPAFNESLLSTQEIYKGVLKRGSVELVLSAGREETSTFKLGIYTNGLTSFVSNDNSNNDFEDDEAKDDSPMTAGMEIAVQGVLMRPLVFFTGQSQLMGHVWSGTASDPTPAYQATTLKQDHEHFVILASGATVYIRTIGFTSIDLNGKVELSLWNRNANTEIRQNTATAIKGLMVVGFTYAKLENEFTITNEPNLSLQADIDFYDDVKLCMQLERPELNLTHSNRKSVFLNASKKYVKHIRTKHIHKAPGRTLALNQKNNEMCNLIHEKSD